MIGNIPNLLPRFLAIVLFGASCALLAEELELEVITLKYRTAQDVLPIVQPFVNQRGGTVSGMRNQLIVRTTPANLAEVRQILAGIDTLPRRLMVTVKQDTGLTTIQSSAQLSGNAAIGKVQVNVPPTGRDGRGLVVERQQGGTSVRAQAQNNESRGNENNVQQLQVGEGSQAFIRVGQSVPAPQQTVVTNPQGTQRMETVQFRDINSGFYVKPRVSGELVTLEVSSQRETAGAGGSVNTQRVSSVVSGRLGEWIELGGIIQNRMQQNSEIASRDSEHNVAQRNIYIKVEEIR